MNEYKIGDNPVYQRIYESGDYEDEHAKDMENSTIPRAKRLLRFNV